MDRFEKIKELGRGATGTVFKAFDNEKGLLVALKIPDPPPESIDVVTHYKREINLLGGLKHPNIVNIESYDIESGIPWIAYEFIKGNTLRELFTSGKDFNSDEATRITLELAHALRYLHAEAIVHRDVNPNNIMVTTDGGVKLMDFGIAHRAGEPFPRQLAGTPGYMSPETAKGEEGGPESDLYSLGLVYYEMLSKTPAFTGESVPEVIGKVISGDFKPLDQVKPGINESIYQIVSKMLAKEPKDRFMSMDQLISQLDRLLSIDKKDSIGHIGHKEEEKKEQSEELLDKPTKITGIGGPYRGYEFELGATITTIGRTYSDIDLSLDEEISYQHCWIVPEDGTYWLYDAEDSGGTFLGGHPIKKARLIPGDRITIGSSTFKWENPSDQSSAYREDSEIEYAPMAQSLMTDKSQTVTGKGHSDYRVKMPLSSFSIYEKTIGIVLAIGFIFGLFLFLNDYYLVPNNETKSILLALEDYWSEMSPIITERDADLVMQRLVMHEGDFDYHDLEAIELRTSPILNLPAPSTVRQINKVRVNIVTRTFDVLNVLRSDVPVDEKIAQIKETRNYLNSVALPQKDTWDSRRLRIDRSLFDLEMKLQQNMVDEQLDQHQTSETGQLRNAVSTFLDAYYLIYESQGPLSVELARQVFDILKNSASIAGNALRRDSADSVAKVILILSNYYMVELRVAHLSMQDWTHEIMNDSVVLLQEGRKLIEEMPAQEYEANVPEQITDASLRVKGRIRAKYINLIDRFQRLTGMEVN